MTDKGESGKLVSETGQTGEPITAKGSKKKRPVDVGPHQTRVNWVDVESELVKAFRAHGWTAERHRVNPSHTVGVVIKHVIPKVVSELLD